ncbi:MAG: hypothetical protein KIT07_06875 [Anaerolineales bacterium]|nr:hypothetical protein [Anaerolineales bacterium]
MRKLSLQNTLLYYDGPELVESIDQIGTTFICLHAEDQNSAPLFVCVPISAGKLTSLKQGELDLRSIFQQPETSEFFVAEATDGNVETLVAKEYREAQLPESWLPDTGFFLDSNLLLESFSQAEATERNRPVIHVRLNPPEAATEAKISAETLSQAITLIQRLVKHAYNKALAERPSTVKLDANEFQPFQLEVYGFAPGSFTLHMQSSSTSDMFGYSFVSEALEIIDNINIDIENIPKAVDKVSKYGGHLAGAYRNLLNFMVQEKTPISYEWSAPNKPSVQKRSMPLRLVEPLYDALIRQTSLGLEYKTFTGFFTKLDVTYRSWRFSLENEDKEFSGETDIDLKGLVIKSQGYEITCEERLSEDSGTGREITKLFMTKVKPK